MRLLAPIEALCVSALLSLSSCALTPRGVAREVADVTPPVAIRSSLHAMNDVENQRLLIQLLASPELRAAARELAGEISDGVTGALSMPERTERIERMAARYLATLTRAFTRSLADGIRHDLSPALAEVVRASVAGALREAARAENQRGLELMAAGLSHATVEAASRAAAEGVRRDLAPSLRAALLDERTAEALAATTRTIARGVVLGSNDAMTHVQQQQERTGRRSFLGTVSNLTQDSVRLVQWVALGAVALSLLLAIWVLRLTVRGKRERAERDRHADSARALAEAVRAAEGRPWSKELTEIIEQRIQGAPVGGMIDDALAARRPGARPSAPPPRA